MLTSQEYISRQEIASLDPPSLGFGPQMQSTTLQKELQPETESRSSAPSETDVSPNITIIKQQISNLKTEYTQKRQRWEEQNSVLVTKDLY